MLSADLQRLLEKNSWREEWRRIEHTASRPEGTPGTSGTIRGASTVDNNLFVYCTFLCSPHSFEKMAGQTLKTDERTSADLRVDPRADLRVDPRVDLRVDPRVDPRADLRADLRVDPRADLRVDPRADLRVDGGIRGKRRKHHGHRQARSVSSDKDLSPRPKRKKKKKKNRKSERKRKSSSSSLKQKRKYERKHKKRSVCCREN
ncbi:hypothetical protein EYF80_059452 [Liparis tanakae]|uniref:Uncharacterized protein n=1 Tax=Liparis tanakae TaxID=230148 RepID=A0A4Z2ENR8_9TELE|nr:hypothetical protein EYF80_059452 [Liparis tanakae]